MVAESLSRVHRDFDAILKKKVSLNWDGQRQKNLSAFLAWSRRTMLVATANRTPVKVLSVGL